MSPIEKLDFVLKFLSTSDKALPYISHAGNVDETIKIKTELGEQHDWGNEVLRILNKLIREGLVDCQSIPREFLGERLDPLGFYKVTFDGKLFIDEQGGYAKKIETKNIRTEQIRLENNKNQLYQLLLVIGAIAAAVGTLALFIWDIYKFHHSSNSN